MSETQVPSFGVDLTEVHEETPEEQERIRRILAKMTTCKAKVRIASAEDSEEA